MADNLKTKVDKLVVYGNEQLASKGVSEQQSTIRGVLDKIGDIQAGGSPSTQAQNIFTGWTMPLTYLNSTDNVFVYESKTHTITITGLDAVGAISDNGTNKVTVTMNVNGTSNTQTPFTITCVKDTETLTYNGLAFHYGSELADGNCLVVAQTLEGTPLDVGYVFIESNSLPLFSSDETTLWNNIYGYQIMTFSFGKWNGSSIGDYFLAYCYSFNQPLTIPNGITSIESNFLRNCFSFNQPLTIPSGVAGIGTYFLRSCQAFNQPLTIPSGLTSIGDYFLSNCNPFNQPLTIPSRVTSIGDYFLAYCYSFNQPLTIPSRVTSIGDYFLAYCYSFNQPLTIPSGLTSIGDYFLAYCNSFNQPLTIPSGVAGIGNYFLRNCYSFNQPLTIPSGVASIGSNFLYNCYSFNQPLTIPSGVASIGSNFLSNCYSLIKLEYNASVHPTDTGSLSQIVNSKPSSNGTGILITGTNANELKESLPDRTRSPYRKLVLQE